MIKKLGKEALQEQGDVLWLSMPQRPVYTGTHLLQTSCLEWSTFSQCPLYQECLVTVMPLQTWRSASYGGVAVAASEATVGQ